jgi:hypothetical protein
MVRAMTEICLKTVRRLRRPVNPKTPIHRRMNARWLAELNTVADRIPCIVEDISAGGAMVHVGISPFEGESVTLTIVDFGPVTGSIAWRRGDRIGLRFDEQQACTAGILAKAAKQATGPVGATRDLTCSLALDVARRIASRNRALSLKCA